MQAQKGAAGFIFAAGVRKKAGFFRHGFR